MESIGELKKIKLFLAISAVATLLLGSLNHFIYEWSGNNGVAGLLFATNESIWEHIKLALLPMLIIFTVGGFFLGKKVNNYATAAFFAMLVMIFFIISAFLCYTFFARRAILPLDITIFTVAIALGYATAYSLFFKRHIRWLNILSCVGIVALYVAFFTLTYHAPKFFLFEEIFVTYTPKY